MFNKKNSLPNFLSKKYRDWKNTTFKEKKKLYKKLVIKGQKPKLMVISCCDSRINVSSIFGADIGDIFIHQNIANIVPPINNKNKQTISGTFAAVEYAVKELKIQHLIVLGHSNCGGISNSIKIFSNKSKKNKRSFVHNWLQFIKPSFKMLPKKLSLGEKIEFIEKENIKNSLKNLYEFPLVKRAIINEGLSVHGLSYNILNGELSKFDEKSNTFIKIKT